MLNFFAMLYPSALVNGSGGGDLLTGLIPFVENTSAMGY